MKNTLLFIFFLVIGITSNAQGYLVVSPQASEIFTANSSSGITASAGTLNLDSGPINGFGGMALNPADGNYYVVGKTSGSQRFLGILSLATNSITTLFNLDDKYAGITFTTSGTCYGITGDGADVPSTLFEINLTSGVATQLVDVSSLGSDGEAICYNSSDGLLYRYAGGSTMQTINPTTLATETIMLSSGVADYGQAMVYEESTGLIVLAAGNLIQHVTTAGTITSSIMAVLGDDDGYKGIVVDPNFVSIEEQLFVSTEVFPNPTNGELSIKNGLGIKSVYVYGIDGREVQQLETEAVRQVDLVLSSGAYLVKTVLSSGVSEIHRVLVN